MPFVSEALNYEIPPDAAQLWRYMDVGRFLTMLYESVLHFAWPWALGDPWEGVPMAYIDEIREHWSIEVRNTLLTGHIARRTVVSSWHENSRESIAMWKLYTSGAEGVAIQTTVGRLKKVFDGQRNFVRLARVRYGDHADALPVSGWVDIQPLIFKRSCHEHEREVRALIVHPFELVAPEDGGEPVQVPVYDPPRGQGLGLRVDLVELVERIVVSPRYPPWAVPALQQMVKRAGLTIQIESSDVSRRPDGCVGPEDDASGPKAESASA